MFYLAKNILPQQRHFNAVLLLLSSLILAGLSTPAQQPAAKPKSKVAQEMARWEKPPGAQKNSSAKTTAKKVPPAPKIVPAAPKPVQVVTRDKAKKTRVKASKKPAIPVTKVEEVNPDAVDELPQVEGYGNTQHNKLVPVTFNGTQPNVEVLSDGETVGTIDDKLTLTAKLKPGPHTVTLVRNGFEQLDYPIEVKLNGKNAFALPALKRMTPVTRPTPENPTPTTPTLVAPTATPTPNPTPTPVVPPIGPSVVEVLRNLDNLILRFKDPNRSETITAQDWNEARNQISIALRRDSGNIELQARDYLAHGQMFFLEKDYFEARKKFREGVRVLPSSSVLQYALGNTFLVSNEPNEAAECFRLAVTQEQTFALAHKALGDAYSKLGDSRNANAEYQRARQLGIVTPEIRVSLGRNLMREPTWGQAIIEFTAAAESAPSAEIYLYLATCYEAQKRPLSALESLLEAVRLDPKAADAYLRLGELYFAQNEFTRAYDSFEKYLIKAPEDPKAKRDAARQRANEARKRAESGKF